MADDDKISLSHDIDTETKTRNSSGDETANVNFLYDDIVHALENTIDTCINSATVHSSLTIKQKHMRIQRCLNPALGHPKFT